MDLDKILFALKSSTRRDIIQILAKEPNSAIGVYLIAKKNDPKTPGREAIYKELQKLVEIGIVEKSYNKASKEIHYELLVHDFFLHLPDMKYELK